MKMDVEKKKADETNFQDILKDYDRVKLKATLISDDHGKTWFVAKQFYLAYESDNETEENFIEIDLEGMVLKEE